MKKLEKLIGEVTTVIVTGGSSGIGESFIKLLHNIKADLDFFNLSRSKPEINCSQLRLHHISCDFKNTQSVVYQMDELFTLVKSSGRGGKVLLINNSGFGSYGLFESLDLQRELDMVAVNVQAPLILTQSLLPVLKERGGVVINVASTASFQPTPYLATYGASKAFLQHWSLSVAEELRGSKVLIHCLCPGPTESRFFEAAGFQEAPLGEGKGIGQTADEVALACLQAVARGQRLVVSGWTNKLLTAFTNVMPRTWIAYGSGVVMKKLRLEAFKAPAK